MYRDFTKMISGTATSTAPARQLSRRPTIGATNVYAIDPLSDPRWEIFTERHPRASVFHTTHWLRALKIAYGYEPLVFTTCPSDMALENGLVFCRVESWLTGRRFVSLPFSDHCEPLGEDASELDGLLLYMRQYVDSRQSKYIEIRPIFHEPGSETGLRKVRTYRFHRLDLARSRQELFHGFHKHCVQRKIRRAEREKLQYEDGSSEALLKKFYELLVVTRRRQYLPPQPLSWFRALLTAFGDKLKIRVASKGDLPIASILTLTHKKSMVYKYGCSDARFHKLGGMALLFWHAIEEAHDRGLEELELGRSDSENLGLISFKEHWGAQGIDLSYWMYAHTFVHTPYAWKKDALRQLVRFTPNRVLRMAGKLLYGHIG
jgi:hypothetical protein